MAEKLPKELAEKFTLDAFQEWLETMSPLVVVGRRWHSRECPLVRYLKTLYPGTDIAVGFGQFMIGQRMFKLPRWARRFVRLVADPRIPPDADEVTVGEALEILRKCR